MNAKVVIQLQGSMDHLRIVWQTGETLLETVAFQEDPEGTRYNVLVAVQEMLTNILRHGYGMDEDQPVEVEFTVTDDEFGVELRDRGAAFDPLAFDTEDLGIAEEMPTEVGGYGIHIARMVMDDLAYERRDGWNCLRLTKAAGVRAGI